MIFSGVRFFHFRNIANAEVNLSGKTVFLTGENGQGKTNFLEALYMLCYGNSFRTRRDKEIIASGETEMSVHGDLADDTRPGMSVDLKIMDGKKDIAVNGKRIGDRKELIDNVPCVLFSHEDMGFLQGGPDRKRWFVNQTMTLDDSSSLDTIREYQKILTLRNACLRSGSTGLIDLYNLQLAQSGVRLMERREAVIRRLNEVFTGVYNDITGFAVPVRLAYHPSWRHVSTVEDALSAVEGRMDRDWEMGMTTSGPHRDSLRLLQGSADYLTLGSTGQLRLAMLVLRVAQALILSGSADKMPLLLFDDVLLELDLEKKKRIVGHLPDYAQAFFTFLPDEYKSFMALPDVQTLRVSGGRLTEA